ncbi:MAG TPA: type VI secretion system protein TssA [Candidatus Saccharimonadales bacterium]|nr:type VI secretion system protein TssA [Candidatus Saccharimonadales bacterium]
MISAEELLKPLTGENPCGVDVSYDPEFQELETLLKGKPESQFAAAEDPDWKALRQRCLELFKKSKDLRVATTLCLAVLKTGDVPEFAQALTVVKGLIESYWPTVFPQLDPADNNDPTQRVNIIAGLATPVGTFGDPMQVLGRLRGASLTNSPQLGRFSLEDILRSEKGEARDGKPPPAATQIQAAFRDTKPEDLQAIHQALHQCLEQVKQIDGLLTQAVGVENSPDLDLLPVELKEMSKRLTPYLPAGTVVEGAGDGAAAEAGQGPAAAARQPITGEISSREDVLKMIDKLCDYYKRSEPSSPVPNILKRARRLAEMDFMQIIGDLSPDSIKEIQRITGEVPADG